MNLSFFLGSGLLLMSVICAGAALPEQVRVEGGIVQGAPGSDSTVRIFKGIPFAAPPVGDLRWKPPQPVQKWGGVRMATEFGQHCMQNNVYGDMVFRDKGQSEDCLYLNVWTPAKSEKDRLPVLVYVYGGGFVAGAASEARYDGENLAKKGVIVVNMNYRLATFGFFSHPELTNESAHNASGNYGLMDQVAAIEWVRKNIKAFGGDPNKVTIGGESAGSFSVSALMASPLSKRLIHGAIGESGAFFTSGKGTLAASPLAESEQAGVEFAKQARRRFHRRTAREISRRDPEGISQGRGRILPAEHRWILSCRVKSPSSIRKREQSHIPLLAGWNADEAKIWFRLSHKVTVAQFTEQAKQAVWRQGRRVSKALSGHHRCGGTAISRGLRRRRVHRLLHLGLATGSGQDRQIAGLLLLLRSDPPRGRRFEDTAKCHGRRPCQRTGVRVPGARLS